MSKSKDTGKKSAKKSPLRSLKEKRAVKAAKKKNKQVPSVD